VTDRYSVLIVRPPGYLHSEAFREVAESLVFGLQALGVDVVQSDLPILGRRPIVLGSNLLATHPQALPPDAILYNLEQIDAGSSWMTRSLVDLFRAHQVWDYSHANAARHADLGLRPPRVVPIGWVPELSRIEAAAEEVDVLFYGSLNERRRTILEALSARGLRVQVAFGVYGEERDRLVARSKVVLNVHYYPAKVFEIVRVSYLLANRRCVVSERGTEPAEEAEFEGGIAFAPYAELVETCVRLCADPGARRQLAEQGFQAIAARDLRKILAEAIGLDPPAHGPPALGTLPERSRMDATATATSAATGPAAPGVPAYYHFDRPEVVARARPAGKRVLDVGCAAGAMGAAMLTAGAAEVAGIEVHPPAAALARGRLTAVYGYDLEAMPALPYPEGYFDVITLADVLEHLRDPLAALRHLRRWLADDGRIVLSLPNVRHESVLLPLLVHGRWDYLDAGILDRTHQRFFTLESMLQLLRDAGFEPEGQLEGVRSAPSPEHEAIAALVGQLGGDVERYRREAVVIQVILSARPSAPAGTRAAPLLDPWRGSRPVRVLVAPDLDNPDDRWAETLATVVDGLGPCEGVTVGVALPLQHLAPPPEALLPVAERSGVDLLLTEAPADQAGWERMLAGASLWIATSDRPSLQQLATRVGLEVQDLSGDEARLAQGRGSPG
jgi:2-polyprenyl-3-methyl-5-hydroxy-6-metoxy-1,4-benzoquinol methylase